VKIDTFFTELKRRNVYKVAIAYVVAGWALSQGIAQVFPVFDVPNWVIRLIVLLIIIGLPIALVLAWMFELTPQGIKRTEDVDLVAAAQQPKKRTWIFVVIIGALVSIGLFFLGRYSAVTRQTQSSGLPAKSIAVLPFGNLSRDPDNEYFAAGIQDEIITRLAQIADLKVISCSSTQRYKGGGKSLRQVASELGVTNILEGSVQKLNDQVHVNVQLLNALTDSHLWADTFDRKLTDVFAVESEVAKTVADTLRAKLTGKEAATLNARPTENSAAHELYLKGRFFWNKRDTPDLQKALGYFREAAAQDPKYALAWSGVADVYVLLPLFGGADPADAYPKAKEAANKAIALDPNLAEPHADLAVLADIFDFDASLSMREFEKAIALNPNYATAHHWFGNSLLEAIGDFDRSIAEMKRAVELDPLSIAINVDLGVSYYYAGRYQDGIVQIRKALDLDANSYYVHSNLGEVLELSGDLPGAIAEYEKSVALDSDPFPLALLGHAQALAGNRADALKILQQLAASSRYAPDYSVGLVYLGLGDKRQAMDWLEKSFAKRQPDLNTLRFDPLLKPLHGDPRFEALAEKILPARELAGLRNSK
jgi:TolB-like protein/tetratricopeptide (TPR) repeat protein